MGAVCENILLEATKLGLGSVWLGIAPRKERMEEKDRFDEKRVHYNGF